jgi:putative copper export protein
MKPWALLVALIFVFLGSVAYSHGALTGGDPTSTRHCKNNLRVFGGSAVFVGAVYAVYGCVAKTAAQKAAAVAPQAQALSPFPPPAADGSSMDSLTPPLPPFY